MNQQAESRWEKRIRETAQGLAYPATPDLATRHRIRPQPRRIGGLGWATAALLIVLLVTLAVPPARASVLKWLQVGPVRIWLVEPTPLSPESPPETPRPTSTPFTSVLDLAGETTLDAARTQVAFPIRLPTYPADLGLPDRVFVQDQAGTAVILVWLEPNRANLVRMSLHELGPGAIVWKIDPVTTEETTVHGKRALWTTGPYAVQIQNGGQWDQRRLLNGHVLIWTEDVNDTEIGYRLETALPLTEAIRIAESLRNLDTFATPEDNIRATVAAASPPKIHVSTPSPEGIWRADVVIHDCTSLGEKGDYAYERLLLTNLADHSERVVAEQLIACGGLGAYGLEVKFWAPNGTFLYFTEDREGVPDGCGFWTESLVRYDLATGETARLGSGAASLDGMRLATWQADELVIWSSDGPEIARRPKVIAGANAGPIVWSPTGESLAYLLNETECPPAMGGTSYVARLDFPELTPDVLLESADPTFWNITWETSDALQLETAQSNVRWSYEFATRILQPAE